MSAGKVVNLTALRKARRRKALCGAFAAIVAGQLSNELCTCGEMIGMLCGDPGHSCSWCADHYGVAHGQPGHVRKSCRLCAEPDKRLCHHLVQVRRGRRIPFDSLRDNGVVVVAAGHYADEDAFQSRVAELARGYRRDKLARQPYHIEVWWGRRS